MPGFQDFSGNKWMIKFICLLANLECSTYKPIYPKTSLGLQTNQFSKMTRTRILSSNQSHNDKSIYDLEQFYLLTSNFPIWGRKTQKSFKSNCFAVLLLFKYDAETLKDNLVSQMHQRSQTKNGHYAEMAATQQFIQFISWLRSHFFRQDK